MHTNRQKARLHTLINRLQTVVDSDGLALPSGAHASIKEAIQIMQEAAEQLDKSDSTENLAMAEASMEKADELLNEVVKKL